MKFTSLEKKSRTFEKFDTEGYQCVPQGESQLRNTYDIMEVKTNLHSVRRWHKQSRKDISSNRLATQKVRGTVLAAVRRDRG